jgi:histone deacetylase 11
LADDPLGGLNISSEAIIKRDEIIISMCIKNKIPVSMVLSGGYQKVNAYIIAESIENLLRKFL